MQNFIVFIDEDGKAPYDISLKGEKMCLNRFCIDEDAAFELSGVKYLTMAKYRNPFKSDHVLKEEKGRKNSLLWS